MGLFDFIKKKIEANAEAERQRKERLLQWQRLVMPQNPNQLNMTEQQLTAITQQQAANDLRIVNDCAKLVESTIKPDVFFMRLQLLLETAEHLCALEQYIKFYGASPAAAFDEVRQNYQLAIRKFLERYFSDTFDKAESMKTEKGRIGKYQKFYDSLQEYYNVMDDNNKAYIERKYKDHIKSRG